MYYKGLKPLEALLVRGSSSRILELLVYAHLSLVIFQIPLRAIIIDTTYIRDILIFVLLGVYVLVFIRGLFNRNNNYLTSIDYLFGFYILYGLFLIVIGLFNDLDLLVLGRNFRNFFLPFMLFFIAKKAFKFPSAQRKLVYFIYLFTVIIILDICFEFLCLEAGVDPHNIPWYDYIFKKSERYIGNELGVPGYIITLGSPVIGILGWQHSTAATLSALFAFSYLMIDKMRRERFIILDTSKLLLKSLYWFLVIFCPIALIILNVKVHLITVSIILFILPFITNIKLFVRNIIILSCSIIIIFSITNLESNLQRLIEIGFVGTWYTPSTIEVILDFTKELEFISNLPLQDLLFGILDIGSPIITNAASFEIRLLLYTAGFGLLWLFLYLGILSFSFFLAWKIIHKRNSQPFEKVFAYGTLGLLIVFFLDMGHYARMMYAPNIDLVAICIGTLSAMAMKGKKVRKSA